MKSVTIFHLISDLIFHFIFHLISPALRQEEEMEWKIK